MLKKLFKLGLVLCSVEMMVDALDSVWDWVDEVSTFGKIITTILAYPFCMAFLMPARLCKTLFDIFEKRGFYN